MGMMFLLRFLTDRESTVMLIEELTDINTDVWNAECDDLNEGLNPHPQLEVANSPDPSTSDSGTYVCNVEVHSDSLIQERDSSSVHRSGSANLSLATYVDDDDVSTQRLDISPTMTSSSYYSAQSTSVPSITSENTSTATPISIPTTPTSDVNKSDLAQEIVDVVQSEGFAMDTDVLHNGSSQFSLFTAGQEGREYQSNTDTELSDSTPVRIECSSLTRNNRASGRIDQQQISLFELDRIFDSTTMREDWEQTML